MNQTGNEFLTRLTLCVAVLALFSGTMQAATYTFTNGSAWLTSNNWTPNVTGTTGPAPADTAIFNGYDGTGGNGAGVNFGNTVNNGVFAGSQGSLPDEAVGMISVTSGNTGTLTIGATKNGASNSGYMTFNGVTFNGQAGTIFANFGTGNLVLANESQNATGSTSGVVLGGAASYVQVGAGDNITITSTIDQANANSSVTLLGNGTASTTGGTLELGGTASTFTGGITTGSSDGSQGGVLQIDTTAALPTSGAITVNANSQVYLHATGTYGGSSQSLTLSGPGTKSNSGALRTGANGSYTWQGNVILASGTDVVTPTTNTTLTISGTMGGGILQKQGGGTLILANGASSFSALINNGTLQLNAASSNSAPSALTVNTGGTLLLGASGAISGTSSTMVMGGGTFNANTFSQGSAHGSSAPGQGLGTLTLSANSTLDFGSGASNNVIAFADSSGLSWSGTLTILDWDGTPGSPDAGSAGVGKDALYIGSSADLAGTGQLADIQFENQGGTIFAAGQAGNGEIYEIAAAPEPRTLLGGMALLGLVGYRERRRISALVRSSMDG